MTAKGPTDTPDANSGYDVIDMCLFRDPPLRFLVWVIERSQTSIVSLGISSTNTGDSIPAIQTPRDDDGTAGTLEESL